ncbi:P27 family phage terminase small subunit [Rummeliibacillus sp. SL167]|uniref:P27 family phage terminase small subunit n=1 Tax=Rummeliibacillus sp. SL167 TaxID=2579792 RepID=UPI0011B66E93|nr:P27 family phage terminase small subunit [Rummeliibacillus sp. SL167]
MNQTKVKKELLSRINPNDNVQLEKVERYMNLLKLYYKLDKSIRDLGVVITTQNGAQVFSKINPAISEKNKINSSLIALSKDLGLENNKIINNDVSDSKSDLL